MPGVPIYRNPGLLSFRIPFTIETRTLYIACATNLTVVEWEAVTGTIMFRRIPESQEGYRMENKKAQALDDDLLENIIGGISLRGVFRHTCRDCQNVWYNEQAYQWSVRLVILT